MDTAPAMDLLVADDDRTSRLILSAILGKCGYRVTAVEDGESALRELCKPEAFRLAILDWMMPGIDGIEVVRRLRARATAEPPYLIVLTQRNATGDVSYALDTGANDYLTKPYDNDELRARVAVGRRHIELQTELARQVKQLRAALDHVNRLQELLPICSHCKKIRDDKNYWHDVAVYISDHSEIRFSHGVCPDCLARHYPG